MGSFERFKDFLDFQYALFSEELQTRAQLPDPLLVVRQYAHDRHFAEIALFCALLSYGNARAIVSFLSRVDFGLFSAQDCMRDCMQDSMQDFIQERLTPNPSLYYRFQSAEDIAHLLKIFRILCAQGGVKEIFLHGYKHATHTPFKILNAIYHTIAHLWEIARTLKIESSQGLSFALGSAENLVPFNPRGRSALKRWNMFARWLVRKDGVDFGLWSEIAPSELLIPLDTHTFNTARKLGLLTRKSADLQAVIELSQNLKTLCPKDPMRYDFALYRIGQQRVELDSALQC
ncbi:MULTISPECIES: TIGR02757 family protein [unclassified Helicobacter]|uniref:TIGR02757 family protein n=1 Tax=unclassified Helicobacter TaxID=2593540 RepID=UPI0015F12A6F|nr:MULTISPECIES: TIGR02757 family protein [unclassified Helicobacter]